MRLLSRTYVAVLAGCFFSLLLAGQALAQSPGSAQPGQAIQPAPLPSDVDPADPALPVWLRPANANTSSTAKAASSTNGQPGKSDTSAAQGRVGEVTKTDHGFNIKTIVENVTLPVTVVDDRSHLVTDLGKSNFTVFENEQPQEIIDFRREDIPVSIGILVDNSGSMREKREKVATAVLNLIKASNPGDEEFIVNFNDDYWIDADFTSNLAVLHEALDRLDSRGGTALYDAVIASCDYLAKAAKRDKKVLIVVTDGEDNSSRESLEQAIRAVQDENGPLIYSIGILGNEGNERRAKRALEALSLQTGGVAYFPKNLSDVDSISQAVARDIRNQYSITYKPSNPQSNGGYRKVKVVARAPGYKDLVARTKTGYFAGQQKTTASSRSGQ